MAGLRGKVVFIDFWEYTCINCIRTFAQNKTWYQRYKNYGFEIVGVHDPEFDVAYPVEHVRAAAKRFGLPYPLVADHWFTIWKSYNNRSWPSRFLIDAKGQVRLHLDGEGADDQFERWIQKLLVEAHPGLKFPESYVIEPEVPAFSPRCGRPTREMYVGNWFDQGVLANREGYHDGKTIAYSLPENVKDGRVILGGRWESEKNGMIYRGKQAGAGGKDRLVMRYTAREIYSVINVARGKPSRLFIQQDGGDLTATAKGADVQFDEQGHAYLDIGEPRMYYLVANPAFGSHIVTLIPTDSGLTVNSFVFGNDCQLNFPHL
jgi:peroxiredoxin